MIKLDNTEVTGWEHAIRGMRNPMNSWDRSDSEYCDMINRCTECHAFNSKRSYCEYTEYANTTSYYYGRNYILGPNDRKLALSLAKSGSVHAKYRRMIVVYVDITAPLYWWKEFDTYKVGTVANSCSTMHKIAEKEFTLDDFSHEYLRVASLQCLKYTIEALNAEREAYIGKALPGLKDDKQCWYNMIQLLPTSYNQKRTVMLNYEVLAGLYPMRKDHKLDEWHLFCDWVRNLPYSDLIIGEEKADAKIDQ
ncbi:MAG: hypothetical protein LUE29_09665 [Lachnospiraceae bacterium]|nr:hypothetical protein [Lachnospiraceae bacterium]